MPGALKITTALPERKEGGYSVPVILLNKILPLIDQDE